MHHLIGRHRLHSGAHQPSEGRVLHLPLPPELRIDLPHLLLLCRHGLYRLTGLLLPLLPFLPEPCILLPQAPQPSIQDLLHSGVEVRLVPAPDQRRKILLLPGVGSRIARPGRLIGRPLLCKPLHPLYLSHGDTSFPW